MATIREKRQEKGWSQMELASRAGVGIQTIYRLEKGKPVMPLVFRAVCAALGADPEEINSPNILNRVPRNEP